MEAIMKKGWELKIDSTLEELIPAMLSEDFSELSASLKKEGQEIPIDLMADGETIIDGHNRKKILEELGKPIKCVIHPEIQTLEQAIRFTVIANKARRHMTTFQKVEFEYLWYQADTKGVHAQLGMEKARKAIAEMTNTGTGTVQRAVKILEKGSEELKTLVRNETLSIYGGYRLVQALEDVPEKTRKKLEEQVVDSGKPDEELMKVVDIIGETNAAKSLLELTSKEVAKKIEAKYKDLFYTEGLDANQVKHDIQVAEGVQPKLKKIYLRKEKLKSEAEAEIYFKKFGGRFIKKAVVEMWMGEVDPYRYKEESEND